MNAVLWEKLSAYLDDQLSEMERSETERTLASDAEARALLSEMRAARSALRSELEQLIARKPAAPSLKNAVMAQIAASARIKPKQDGSQAVGSGSASNGSLSFGDGPKTLAESPTIIVRASAPSTVSSRPWYLDPMSWGWPTAGIAASLLVFTLAYPQASRRAIGLPITTYQASTPRTMAFDDAAAPSGPRPSLASGLSARGEASTSERLDAAAMESERVEDTAPHGHSIRMLDAADSDGVHWEERAGNRDQAFNWNAPGVADEKSADQSKEGTELSFGVPGPKDATIGGREAGDVRTLELGGKSVDLPARGFETSAMEDGVPKATVNGLSDDASTDSIARRKKSMMGLQPQSAQPYGETTASAAATDDAEKMKRMFDLESAALGKPAEASVDELAEETKLARDGRDVDNTVAQMPGDAGNKTDHYPFARKNQNEEAQEKQEDFRDRAELEDAVGGQRFVESDLNSASGDTSPLGAGEPAAGAAPAPTNSLQAVAQGDAAHAADSTVGRPAQGPVPPVPGPSQETVPPAPELTSQETASPGLTLPKTMLTESASQASKPSTTERNRVAEQAPILLKTSPELVESVEAKQVAEAGLAYMEQDHRGADVIRNRLFVVVNASTVDLPVAESDLKQVLARVGLDVASENDANEEQYPEGADPSNVDNQPAATDAILNGRKELNSRNEVVAEERDKESLSQKNELNGEASDARLNAEEAHQLAQRQLAESANYFVVANVDQVRQALDAMRERENVYHDVYYSVTEMPDSTWAYNGDQQVADAGRAGGATAAQSLNGQPSSETQQTSAPTAPALLQNGEPDLTPALTQSGAGGGSELFSNFGGYAGQSDNMPQGGGYPGGGGYLGGGGGGGAPFGQSLQLNRARSSQGYGNSAYRVQQRSLNRVEPAARQMNHSYYANSLAVQNTQSQQYNSSLGGNQRGAVGDYGLRKRGDAQTSLDLPHDAPAVAVFQLFAAPTGAAGNDMLKAKTNAPASQSDAPAPTPDETRVFKKTRAPEDGDKR